jgi:hypothetical protein
MDLFMDPYDVQMTMTSLLLVSGQSPALLLPSGIGFGGVGNPLQQQQ